MGARRIAAIDVDWLGHARSIAACLLEGDGFAALVDPGPAVSLPALREGLRSHGLSPADLDAVLLTHIHLDHAGAVGALVRENPRLAVYVHATGAPHMAHPAKLLESAGRLYGDRMERLYGAFLAVPQENLRALQGGESLSLGRFRLDVLHTPGHARHHVCYFDSSEGVAFAGDTAGIRIQGDTFVLPATPPPDVDLELWESSLAAILSRHPARLFVTHFGFSDDPQAHVEEFRERLRGWAARARQLLRASGDEAAALAAFVESVRSEVEKSLPAPEIAHYLFNGGVDLSWLGLARYWRKREAAQTPAG